MKTSKSLLVRKEHFGQSNSLVRAFGWITSIILVAYHGLFLSIVLGGVGTMFLNSPTSDSILLRVTIFAFVLTSFFYIITILFSIAWLVVVLFAPTREKVVEPEHEFGGSGERLAQGPDISLASMKGESQKGRSGENSNLLILIIQGVIEVIFAFCTISLVPFTGLFYANLYLKKYYDLNIANFISVDTQGALALAFFVMLIISILCAVIAALSELFGFLRRWWFYKQR